MSSIEYSFSDTASIAASTVSSVESIESAGGEIPRYTNTKRVFTSEDRDAIIAHAAGATETLSKGDVTGFKYRLLEKLNAPSEIDTQSTQATQALANVVFHGEPRFRLVTMLFMKKLSGFLSESPVLRSNANNYVVVVKGGTAYHLIAQGSEQADKLPAGDFDVSIYINPYIPAFAFNSIHAQIKRTVLRAISDAKSRLDTTFFLHKGFPQAGNDWLTPQEVEAFKDAHIAECQAHGLVSPFESTDVRNAISGNSFMIINSDTMPETKVVRVEVPSFKFCERIPLRRTPVSASVNETIDFWSTNGTVHRRFELYRLKMNVGAPKVNVGTFVEEDGHVLLGIRPSYQKVHSDLIDVSIPLQGDHEGTMFWNNLMTARGMSVTMHFDINHIPVLVPSVQACINDLEMMLNVYECPEGKRGKREEKLQVLKSLL